MTHFRNWFEAALVAAFLLVVSAVLDGPDEVQAAVDTELASRDAAKADEREQIVWRVCRSLHAERAQVLETVDGDLVCRRRAEVL